MYLERKAQHQNPGWIRKQTHQAGRPAEEIERILKRIIELATTISDSVIIPKAQSKLDVNIAYKAGHHADARTPGKNTLYHLWETQDHQTREILYLRQELTLPRSPVTAPDPLLLLRSTLAVDWHWRKLKSSRLVQCSDLCKALSITEPSKGTGTFWKQRFLGTYSR